MDDLANTRLRLLLAAVPHGEAKILAARLGVHATTVSRWTWEKMQPQESHQDALCQYFGLTREQLSADDPSAVRAAHTRLERREYRLKLSQREVVGYLSTRDVGVANWIASQLQQQMYSM